MKPLVDYNSIQSYQPYQSQSIEPQPRSIPRSISQKNVPKKTSYRELHGFTNYQPNTQQPIYIEDTAAENSQRFSGKHVTHSLSPPMLDKRYQHKTNGTNQQPHSTKNHSSSILSLHKRDRTGTKFERASMPLTSKPKKPLLFNGKHLEKDVISHLTSTKKKIDGLLEEDENFKLGFASAHDQKILSQCVDLASSENDVYVLESNFPWTVH